MPVLAGLVAAPGTQSLIGLLPRLRPARRVAVFGFGYQEHPASWTAAGAEVLVTTDLGTCAAADVAVVVNPNNPDGRRVAPDALADLAARLARHDGTLVVDEDEIMEKEAVTGIAYARDESKFTLRHLPDRPGVASSVFGPLSDANVNVDMIVQNVSAEGTTDLTFTVSRADLSRTRQILEEQRQAIGFREILSDSAVAKISVVGVGMRSHSGVASTMFRTLAEKAINIQVITTSEIKVSVLVGEEYTELAVRALHTAYGLDAPA